MEKKLYYILHDKQVVATLADAVNIFLEVDIWIMDKLATVWAALNAFVSKYLGYSSIKAKESKEKLQIFEKKISDLKEHLAGKYDESTFRGIRQLKFYF